MVSYNDVSGNPNHIANINPIRYRSYYYDTETGSYYLHSRYYDPVIGRFINADGYVSTGQGMLGTNMFVYGNNNPIGTIDKNGEAPLKVARYLLTHWIKGKGKKLTLDKKSFVSKKIKKSSIMKTIIKEEIAKYKEGKSYGTGRVCFNSDETDLWLGVRKASYKMTIETETKTRGFWIFKKTQTRYVANVTVSDTYNFNIGNEEGDGIGSILNNWAYWADENGIGVDYKWEAEFVYETKWETVD